MSEEEASNSSTNTEEEATTSSANTEEEITTSSTNTEQTATTSPTNTEETCASYSISSQEASFELDCTNFADIRESKAFVDKTLLIKQIFNAKPYIVLTAPYGFGKSTNMDMLKKFIEIQVDSAGVVIDRATSSNRHLFKHLLIAQDASFFNKHFATYPVVHVSFKDVRGYSYEECLNGFRDAINAMYSEHEYLLTSHIWHGHSRDLRCFLEYFDMTQCAKIDSADIEDSLDFLATSLYLHFNKKVFVLIDDYDAPLYNTMFEFDGVAEELTSLLNSILSFTFKESQHVKRALITGIFNFTTFSELENITKYTFLTEKAFAPFFGLTLNELERLFGEFEVDPETQEKVKAYYDGYVSLDGTKLFATCSIILSLCREEIRNYWAKFDSLTKIRNAMNWPCIRQNIEKLCSEETVHVQISNKIKLNQLAKLAKICSQEQAVSLKEQKELHVSADLFMNFLVQQGYLTFDKFIEHSRFPLGPVRVPNMEILDQLRKVLKRLS